MKTKITGVLLVLLGTGQGCALRSKVQLAPPAASGPVTLQAGTTLAFRTAQAIDSSSSQPDQTFAAVVTRDARDEQGQTALASGSPATLILVQPAGGKFELRLASLTLNGNSFMVRNVPETSTTGSSLGRFIGGVPGTERPLYAENGAGFEPLAFNEGLIRVPVGSLLTFRLELPIRLISSP